MVFVPVMLSILPDRLVTQQLLNHDDDEPVADGGNSLKVQHVDVGGDGCDRLHFFFSLARPVFLVTHCMMRTEVAV